MWWVFLGLTMSRRIETKHIISAHSSKSKGCRMSHHVQAYFGKKSNLFVSDDENFLNMAKPISVIIFGDKKIRQLA